MMYVLPHGGDLIGSYRVQSTGVIAHILMHMEHCQDRSHAKQASLCRFKETETVS